MKKGESSRVLIICEVGVNHNGSVDRALSLVDAAAATGADIVKFQTFNTDSLVTRTLPQAAYQARNVKGINSQFEMLKALELGRDAHLSLAHRARAQGIKFLSTPFDLESVDLLVDELSLPMLKVSSGDLTNAPLLLKMAQSKVDVILSTGMATPAEITEALSVLAFGYTSSGVPSRSAFRSTLATEAGQKALTKHVSLLHCTSDYPALLADVNLRAMDTLHEMFGLQTGYSDHTQGISVSLAAAARGAAIIEKHMTLDRDLPGPDHKASLIPSEFATMVAGIREIEQALGTAEKAPTTAELATRRVARKVLVAAKPIGAGDLFSLENLTSKRAIGDVQPIALWDLVGKRAHRAYSVNESIEQ